MINYAETPGKRPAVGNRRKDYAHVLLTSYQKGDESAFTELYNTLRDPLLGYLQKRFGFSTCTSEDLVQETFLRINSYIDRYKTNNHGNSNGYNWIRTILDNLAKNELRRKERKDRCSEHLITVNGVVIDQIANFPSGEDIAETLYSRQMLKEGLLALAHLSSEKREALYLRAIKGMSYREIKESLNIPLGTVHTLMNRGRKEVKYYFESKGWRIHDDEQTILENLETLVNDDLQRSTA